MKNLKDILHNISFECSSSIEGVKVLGISMDSREVSAGFVFVAVKGTKVDGNDFVKVAEEKGAVAIVTDCKATFEATHNIPVLLVSSAAEALGFMATAFYDFPSTKLKLVAVTGTNGKTSVATLLYRLYSELGYRAGLLSTVENRIADKVIPSTHTTPDAVSLNALLAQMVDEGCDFAFIEASSHAIHQQRIAGLTFAGGVFTNLTHDHLDYHGTFAEYRDAKKLLFDKHIGEGAFALVNSDDRNGEFMVQNSRAAIHTYALRRPADFKGKILENNLTGLSLLMDGTEFHSKLVGDFNAYNLLAIYGAAILLGNDKMEILTALSAIGPAEGRFEYVFSKRRNVLGIVDYAHTPDALEKVLLTVNNLKNDGRVITVVGCGGDRDKTKRPVMAKVAAEKSDMAILTSDNPRTESPEAILSEMEAGIPIEKKSKTLTITDRLQAIRTAVAMAQSGDVILLAGKGHEKYQEINGVKFPFDDKAVLEELIVGN